MDADPMSALARRRRERLKPASPWQIALVVLAAVAACVVLFTVVLVVISLVN